MLLYCSSTHRYKHNADCININLSSHSSLCFSIHTQPCKSIHEQNFIFIFHVSIGQVPQSTNTFHPSHQNRCINHAVTFLRWNKPSTCWSFKLSQGVTSHCIVHGSGPQTGPPTPPRLFQTKFDVQIYLQSSLR